MQCKYRVDRQFFIQILFNNRQWRRLKGKSLRSVIFCSRPKDNTLFHNLCLFIIIQCLFSSITPKSLFLEISLNEKQWNIMITDRSLLRNWKESLVMRQWIRIHHLKKVTIYEVSYYFLLYHEITELTIFNMSRTNLLQFIQQQDNQRWKKLRRQWSKLCRHPTWSITR